MGCEHNAEDIVIVDGKQVCLECRQFEQIRDLESVILSLQSEVKEKDARIAQAEAQVSQMREELIRIARGTVEGDGGRLILNAVQLRVIADKALSTPSPKKELEEIVMKRVREFAEEVRAIGWIRSDCRAEGHDDRWCSHCSSVNDGIDFVYRVIDAALSRMESGNALGKANP